MDNADPGTTEPTDSRNCAKHSRRRPPPPDSAWLDWVGPIPAELARRIACDADVWRAILDPRTSLPLDVGRAYRVAPHWIRKALHARDRHCRFTGCEAPAQWCDAHHLDHWIDGGRTQLERSLLLCRHHHRLVHEGGWTIEFDADGDVRVLRPDGTPYELGSNSSWTGPIHRRAG